MFRAEDWVADYYNVPGGGLGGGLLYNVPGGGLGGGLL